MNKTVPIVVVVVVVIGVLAFYSLIPTIFPQPSHSASTTIPNSLQTFHEGQLFITTGVTVFGSPGNQLYFLNTSLRSLTQSQVVGIRATLDYSNGISETDSWFFVGHAEVMSAQVTTAQPLGYNTTANIERFNLSPPAPLQLGQTLSETLNVTFQNGTSTTFHVTAQVVSGS